MEKLYDVLNYDNLKIYQNDEWFCFSLDSVILANFPKIRYSVNRIAELGTGNAIVPLILSKRTKAFIDAIEIQSDLADLANKNVKYNELGHQIEVINIDMKDFSLDPLNHDKYELVLANPPYFSEDTSCKINDDIHKAIARHEICITINDLLKTAWRILKEGGRFAMVCRVDRFIEIIQLFKSFRFEVKYIRFVHDTINKPPALFYLEAVKLGKSGLMIDMPFVLRDGSGDYTDEYNKLQNEVML